MKVNLDGVAETLLITVRARAEETLRPDALLHDPYAVDILNQFQFEESAKNKVAPSSKIGIVVRTIIMDKMVQDFMDRNPDGVIVALGCGLDARYERLGKPETEWYDIDVEEAIGIREKFFREKQHYKMVAKSMFDDSWMERIPKDKPVFIISEGVMMYFTENELKPLFIKIYDTFPDVEMAFDTIAPFLAKRTKLHSEVKKYNVRFGWGLGDAGELKKWDERITILQEEYYFDYHLKRWPLSMRLLSLFPRVRKWNRIVHTGKAAD